MEFNKSVSNPMLVGTIELMREEDTAEHRNMFIDEMVKASYMAPAVIVPEPVTHPDGSGRPMLDINSKIQFPVLSTPDGKTYFMAFTDPVEYKKWADRNRTLYTFKLKFEDYGNMLFNPDSQGNLNPALGLVINPMGANVIIPRDLIAGVLATRMPEVQEYIRNFKKQEGIPDAVPESAEDEEE